MLLQARRSKVTAPSLTVGLLPRRLDQFRETEIQNLGMAITRHHYVVRLEIPVDDARGMCFCESFSYVLQVAQKLREIGLLLMEKLTQGQTINEFHRDEVHAISFT